jgi:hypothetical protein
MSCAVASTAFLAAEAGSPVRDISAAMSPATSGAENDVPSHVAIPAKSDLVADATGWSFISLGTG